MPAQKIPNSGAEQQPMPQSKLLSERDVAELLSISIKTLQAQRYKGVGIPFYRIGRVVRYREAEVLAFIEAGRVNTNQEAA
jgi:predicted DNA-binding transcriptional regulator AlpA